MLVIGQIYEPRATTDRIFRYDIFVSYSRKDDMTSSAPDDGLKLSPVAWPHKFRGELREYSKHCASSASSLTSGSAVSSNKRKFSRPVIQARTRTAKRNPKRKL